MKVTREVILELIGKAQGYHSCVLTTYSFDPVYFELNILRALRSAGIRNVVVFIDGQMHSQLVDDAAHHQLHATGSYGVWPVFRSGAFHPKMLFAVGEEKGFLAIGSGNLTAGGHGSNDEVWSALHASGADSPNAQLFAGAWRMFKAIGKETAGSVRERLDWVSEHGPWLKELPLEGSATVDLGKQEVTFVGGPDDRLGNMVEARIGRDEVQRIVVVSPFFDAGGVLLDRWQKRWKGVRIHTIVDDRLGTLPHALERSVANAISWYPWHAVPLGEEDEKARNRRKLHAKAVVFELRGGRELAYVGSANASVAAWGLDSVPPANVEAGVIIERSTKSLAKELGVDPEKWTATPWKELGAGLDPVEPAANAAVKWPIHLVLAEQDGVDLIVHAERAWNKECRVQLRPISGEEVLTVDLSELEERNVFKVVGNMSNTLCRMVNMKGTALSNSIIVQDMQAHLNCNPDRKLAKLQALLTAVESGEAMQLDELLHHAVFTQIEEDEQDVVMNRKPGATKEVRTGGEEKKSYEEFTKVSAEALARQRGLLQHASIRIADLLSGLMWNLANAREDIDQLRDRESDLATDEGLDDQVVCASRSYTWDQQKAERDAVFRYLRRYMEHLMGQVENGAQVATRSAVTLVDHSNFLIASWLVLSYTGRHFRDELGNDRPELFMQLQGEKAWNNLRDFSELILTDYLMCCMAAPKVYEVGSVQRKMEGFVSDAFGRALILLCAQKWNERERSRFEMLALNVLYRMPLQGLPVTSAHVKRLMRFAEREKFYCSDHYEANLEHLCGPLVNSMVATLHAKSKNALPTVPAQSLVSGHLVFSSTFGIGLVNRTLRLPDGMYDIYMVRPGDMDGARSMPRKAVVRISI